MNVFLHSDVCTRTQHPDIYTRTHTYVSVCTYFRIHTHGSTALTTIEVDADVAAAAVLVGGAAATFAALLLQDLLAQESLHQLFARRHQSLEGERNGRVIGFVYPFFIIF